MQPTYPPPVFHLLTAPNKVQVLCPHARRRAAASKASDHSLYCQDQRHGLHRGSGKWLSESKTTKKTTETGAFHPGWGSSGLYFAVGPHVGPTGEANSTGLFHSYGPDPNSLLSNDGFEGRLKKQTPQVCVKEVP